MKDIVIIGAGGHTKVILDILFKRQEILKENINIIGILDDKKQGKVLGIPVLGKIEIIKEKLLGMDYEYIIGIGDNQVRKNISEKYKNIKYYTAIHPMAVIGKYVEIGIGTVIMSNVIVNPDTKIGKHCILNTSSIIEHDNLIKDYVHISPNATLCGGVEVGTESWIGANSVVKQQKKIGQNVIVGAGAVITNNIENNCTVVGNPGRVIKVSEEN